ncbi:hypothetical protein ACWDA7_30530 [Streptomyces sp. NPDC001156]
MLPNAELWAAALGYVLPLAIAVVNQPRWRGWVKGLLMLVVAAGDGAGTAYFGDQFHGRSVVSTVLIAAIAIGVAYHTVWKPSGIAPALERATSAGGVESGA